MAQSLRQDFSDELAKMVFTDIQTKRGRYYYFLGGVEPWNGIGGSNVDDEAPAGEIAQTEEINRKYRSEIAFVKTISPNDISLAIRKIEWKTGTVYDEWDHTQDMVNKDFYVITEDFNVYKCLDNNRAVPSTVKPTGNSIYPFVTSDGYKWKYMYNVPPFKRLRFSSVNYIPVQKALSDSFYNNGEIESVSVLAEGSGYTDDQLTSISVATNTTVGTGAFASVVVDVVGAITEITILNGGEDYSLTAGVEVKITSSGAGVGARARVIGVNATTGAIEAIEILDGGIGYSAATTTVEFIVGGAVLIPVISTDTGEILDVKIVNPGIGYATAPELTVLAPGYTVTGKYGNATALLECIVYQGSIRHVNIIDPGLDYPFDSSTSILIEGDGTGAILKPVINDGRIVDVYVENPGSGYTSIILSVQNVGVGTGAKLEAAISQSDYISDQMVVEQTAIQGAIYNIKVTEPGQGYIGSTTTAVVTGNGSGCVVSPVVVDGKVVEVQVLNPGSGYTYATVEIFDSGRAYIAPEDMATAYVILPPLNGHGYDATQELFAQVLAINTPLRGEMQIEGVTQEYRNFGIIRNPRTLAGGERYSRNSEVLVYIMKFTSTTSLIKDEILYLDTNRFRVLEITNNNVSLIPVDRDDIIPLGTLTSERTNINYQSTETVKTLEFDKYSGSLLYISTENPFSFAVDQSVTIKTFIKF